MGDVRKALAVTVHVTSSTSGAGPNEEITFYKADPKTCSSRGEALGNARVFKYVRQAFGLPDGAPGTITVSEHMDILRTSQEATADVDALVFIASALNSCPHGLSAKLPDGQTETFDPISSHLAISAVSVGGADGQLLTADSGEFIAAYVHKGTVAILLSAKGSMPMNKDSFLQLATVAAQHVAEPPSPSQIVFPTGSAPAPSPPTS